MKLDVRFVRYELLPPFFFGVVCVKRGDLFVLMRKRFLSQLGNSLGAIKWCFFLY